MTSVSFVDYHSLEIHAPIPLTAEDLRWRLGIEETEIPSSRPGKKPEAYALPEPSDLTPWEYVVQGARGEALTTPRGYRLSQLPLQPVLKMALREAMDGSDPVLAQNDTVAAVLNELRIPGLETSHPVVQDVAEDLVYREWSWNLAVVRRRLDRWGQAGNPADMSSVQRQILERQLDEWLPGLGLPNQFWEVLEDWSSWFSAVDLPASRTRPLLKHSPSECTRDHDCALVRKVGFELSGAS